MGRLNTSHVHPSPLINLPRSCPGFALVCLFMCETPRRRRPNLRLSAALASFPGGGRCHGWTPYEAAVPDRVAGKKKSRLIANRHPHSALERMSAAPCWRLM